MLMRLPQSFDLPEVCSVVEALRLIGLTENEAQSLLQSKSVAVFGNVAHAEQVLRPGDRIEILDELRFDPKESRRRRVNRSRLQK